MDIIDLTLYKKDALDESAIVSKYPFTICRFEKTEELCLIAVRADGKTLKEIPKKCQTEMICIEAVKQNGEALKHVSKKLITYEMCKIAVTNNGEALNFVPDKYKDGKLCEIAIANSGSALAYVPESLKSKNLCLKAIKNKSSAIQYVPREMLEKEEYIALVQESWKNLGWIDKSKRLKKLCTIAFEQNPLSIMFIPEKFITEGMCEKALAYSWKSILYMPQDMLTTERLLLSIEKYEASVDKNDYRATFARFFENLSKVKRIDNKIIEAQRKCGIREIFKKVYDKSIKKFVVYEGLSEENQSIHRFSKFEKFYNFLHGNLSGAELEDYDFHDVDLNKYNIEGAIIPAKALVNQGLYDSSFYDSIVNGQMFELENSHVENDSVAVLHNYDFQNSWEDTHRKVFYISDIHLNHKIAKKFPYYATKNEINRYIINYVNELLESVTVAGEDILLIGGDISSTFCVSEIFYNEVSKKWHGLEIFVVLGNHELWNTGENLAYDEIVKKYKLLCRQLGIKCLHNDLAFLTKDYFIRVFSYEEICKISETKLEELSKNSIFTIYGGIGFSGYNKEYNAKNGLYRDTITFTQELKETEKFEKAYLKIQSAIKNPVVVFSHMPKDCWSQEKYISNWIYVNGHTHRNQYCEDENKTVYSDNQIGYYSTKSSLKWFYQSISNDIFREFPDGIYKISREQYEEFYREKHTGTAMSFNEQSGIIYMIKRNNLYCFIFENEIGKRYFLSGGAKRSTEKDIIYYYENISKYSHVISQIMKEYYEALKALSASIKSFGGSGKIHGSIVDIDFFNHVYLNPYDGKQTAYYALSAVQKIVYSDLKELLFNHAPKLLEQYEKKLSERENLISYTEKKKSIRKFVLETEMYAPSNLIGQLQYIDKFGIVRFWDDSIIGKIAKIGDTYQMIE